MEKIILGVIEKHLKDTAVIGHVGQGFSSVKSCLTHLISFYDKVTHLADKGQDMLWISAKLLNPSLTVAFWHGVQLCARQARTVRGEQLPARSAPRAVVSGFPQTGEAAATSSKHSRLAPSQHCKKHIGAVVRLYGEHRPQDTDSQGFQGLWTPTWDPSSTASASPPSPSSPLPW